MNGLVSGAAVRYLQGDESGASAAAFSLMAQHPEDRRVLHTVVSLAALAGDTGLVQQASRALQASVVVVRFSSNQHTVMIFFMRQAPCSLGGISDTYSSYCCVWPSDRCCTWCCGPCFVVYVPSVPLASRVCCSLRCTTALLYLIRE